LLGPEFQIYSTQTASDRADIVNTALYGALTRHQGQSDAVRQQAGQCDRCSLHRLCFPAQRHVVALPQAGDHGAANAQTRRRQGAGALYVVLTSSEYQVIQ
jgi:hypothetical protein